MAPVRFSIVNNKTRTPVLATAVAAVTVLAFALWLPVGTLAQITSLIILLVFAVMHLALIRLKMLEPQPDAVSVIPLWWPVVGLILTLGLILLRGMSIADT